MTFGQSLLLRDTVGTNKGQAPTRRLGTRGREPARSVLCGVRPWAGTRRWVTQGGCHGEVPKAPYKGAERVPRPESPAAQVPGRAHQGPPGRGKSKPRSRSRAPHRGPRASEPLSQGLGLTRRASRRPELWSSGASPPSPGAGGCGQVPNASEREGWRQVCPRSTCAPRPVACALLLVRREAGGGQDGSPRGTSGFWA